jgi:hypothetical protein
MMSFSCSDNTQQDPAVAVSVPTIDEFPTLGERPSTPQQQNQQRGAWVNDTSRGIHSTTDFPALAGAANNVSNTNVSQARGIWREQQQQQQIVSSSSSTTQNATPKKASQPVKPVVNGVASMNIREDFPALRGASSAKIPAPVSMFSTWSTAKKSSKNVNGKRRKIHFFHANMFLLLANAKANQPQMRMNTNRLVNDDDDDEYIRRPMSDLTTSVAPTASSNITMISSSDVSGNQINEKQNKNKNQSIPNARDFPALTSTTPTQNNGKKIFSFLSFLYFYF